MREGGEKGEGFALTFVYPMGAKLSRKTAIRRQGIDGASFIWGEMVCIQIRGLK